MYGLYNNYFNVLDNIVWKVAIYVRLSREDEKDDRYKGQSESIENQINYLKPIVVEKKWILVDTYIDDGYTGTNFDRPNFQRMIRDVELGKVNLVITKDLSRLGRDYIETGRYVEKYFPSKNVRYIAVNDNIDTFDKKNSNNDITPFKSVINDMYAKDISNKVRSAILTKATEGECIKAFLPYGYKKDIYDKNKILIDENVADNVVLIFELYKNGKSKSQIADYLNELGIKTPLQYKLETTNYFNPNKTCTYKWNSTIVNKILRDRIYVGDLVQLKYAKVNYKVQKMIKVPKEQHVIVLNHHPAIIERSTFEIVQEMLDRQTNEWNYSGRNKHLLTGLVFCQCGSRITYNKNHGKYFRCICSSYKKYGSKFCSSIHLREDELIRAVTNSLKENVSKYLNMDNLSYQNKSPNTEFGKNISNLNKKKEELNKIISNLYEDRLSGVISQDTFMDLVKNYETQKKECDKRILLFKNEQNKSFSEDNINRELLKETMQELLTFNDINEENKSIVFKLVDKIIIYDRDISIKYKFNIPV